MNTNGSELNRVVTWLLGNDCGVSSKTIVAALTGTPMTWPDIPHDSADFGRCYRLLQAIPEFRARLNEVADVYPKWAPVVAIWEALESLHENDDHRGIFDALWAVRDECMRADGYVKTGPHSWKKEAA